jgi:hypothetical protein
VPVTKLTWSGTRSKIMKKQNETSSKVDACWAAVTESVVAFYTHKDHTLNEIETAVTSKGIALGAHGAKDFGQILMVFDIYDDGKKNTDGFAQTTQVFNFIKKSIDAKRPVILGWKGSYPEADGQAHVFRHAGMIFGYDDTGIEGKVFVMEPATILLEANYDAYISTPRTMQDVFFDFGRLKVKATEIYKTKPPTAPAQPPAPMAVINKT